MKKVLSFVLAICMLFALTACGSNGGKQDAASGDLSNDQQSNAGPIRQKKQKVDVDLTKLSSTMVYSEVFNMMYAPEDYNGKTVKMNGAFALYCQRLTEDGQPDLDYPISYACVIADATACCAQGLEFVLSGDHSYPDDFPELGKNITVMGTFETYEEGGSKYIHLVNAELST